MEQVNRLVVFIMLIGYAISTITSHCESGVDWDALIQWVVTK